MATIDVNLRRRHVRSPEMKLWVLAWKRATWGGHRQPAFVVDSQLADVKSAIGEPLWLVEANPDPRRVVALHG